MAGTDVLKDILALSVHAPSGDNAQPWLFWLDGSSVVLRNAHSDATLYNYKQRGSLLSHGAVIENIAIAAHNRGLNASVTYLPGGDAVARVAFSPMTPERDPLLAAIPSRTTNRKPYEKRPLDAAHADALTQAAAARGFELRFITDRPVIDSLSVALSLNERLLMENRQLHDFLFGMIRFTKKEEAERPGLYIRTMEFPAPVRALLRFVVKHWNATQALNRIGLSRAIPKQSAELYRSSSALCALIIDDLSDETFIKAGRAFQRVWLTAESLGISLQPTTALPYLAQRLETGETESLSAEHIEAIRDAYVQIHRAFRLGEQERIAMLFRVGYGPKPTASSAKLPPVFIAP
jgi:nitroreductase